MRTSCKKVMWDMYKPCTLCRKPQNVPVGSFANPRISVVGQILAKSHPRVAHDIACLLLQQLCTRRPRTCDDRARVARSSSSTPTRALYFTQKRCFFQFERRCVLHLPEVRTPQAALKVRCSHVSLLGAWRECSGFQVDTVILQ